jgi:alkanesulfonate monooxygenase SsuD/methylene tetrahydromethanopterin reductase-like flavin-dependent oxidoreductase (luciferase family)
MEDIVERGYVVIGSPEEVAEQLTELARPTSTSAT